MNYDELLAIAVGSTLAKGKAFEITPERIAEYHQHGRDLGFTNSAAEHARLGRVPSLNRYRAEGMAQQAVGLNNSYAGAPPPHFDIPKVHRKAVAQHIQQGFNEGSRHYAQIAGHNLAQYDSGRDSADMPMHRPTEAALNIHGYGHLLPKMQTIYEGRRDKSDVPQKKVNYATLGALHGTQLAQGDIRTGIGNREELPEPKGGYEPDNLDTEVSNHLHTHDIPPAHHDEYETAFRTAYNGVHAQHNKPPKEQMRLPLEKGVKLSEHYRAGEEDGHKTAGWHSNGGISAYRDHYPNREAMLADFRNAGDYYAGLLPKEHQARVSSEYAKGAEAGYLKRLARNEHISGMVAKLSPDFATGYQHGEGLGEEHGKAKKVFGTRAEMRTHFANRAKEHSSDSTARHLYQRGAEEGYMRQVAIHSNSGQARRLRKDVTPLEHFYRHARNHYGVKRPTAQPESFEEGRKRGYDRADWAITSAQRKGTNPINEQGANFAGLFHAARYSTDNDHYYNKEKFRRYSPSEKAAHMAGMMQGMHEATTHHLGEDTANRMLHGIEGETPEVARYLW